MNTIIKNLSEGNIVATVLAQSAFPDFISQLNRKQPLRITLFTNSDELEIFYLKSNVTCINTTHSISINIKDAQLTLFHVNQITLPLLLQFYNFYQSNPFIQQILFLQSPTLTNFQFNKDIKVINLSSKVTLVSAIQLKPNQIIYRKSIKNVKVSDKQAIITQRDSLSLQTAVYEQLRNGQIYQIYSDTPLFFTAKIVSIEDSVEFASFLELGTQIEILQAGNNDIVLDDTQIASELLKSTFQPIDNTAISTLFVPDTLKFVYTTSWKTTLPNDLAQFVRKVLKFTHLSRSQFAIFKIIQQGYTNFIPFSSRFIPGDGICFGIIIFSLMYIKKQHVKVGLISSRRKFARAIEALCNSSLRSARKWILLTDDISQTTDCALIMDLQKGGLSIVFPQLVI
eukprot:EST48718.1 Hypothetical protein SS50377_11034 [Spironucleus salmonicida]